MKRSAVFVLTALTVVFGAVLAACGSGSPSSVSGAAGQAQTSFSSAYRADSSGVVKILASTCGGTGEGSGVLLKSGMVATVAHVVHGAVAVGITAGNFTTNATVVGYDAARDLALLKPSTPIPGHPLAFDTTTAAVGSPIAAIGYPFNQPQTLTTGAISGLDRTVPISGVDRNDMIETDASLNPGNSGGPLITSSGQVVGLVDAKTIGAAGIGYAVNGPVAAKELAAWQADPQPQAAGSCQNALGPSAAGAPAIGGPVAGSSTAADIASTLTTYFTDINDGNYAGAYGVIDRNQPNPQSLQQFASGDSTSYDFNIKMGAISSLPGGEAGVPVTFTSIQDPAFGPNGDACDNWTLNYTMVNVNGTWLIQSATGQNGSTHTPC